MKWHDGRWEKVTALTVLIAANHMALYEPLYLSEPEFPLKKKCLLNVSSSEKSYYL